MPEPAVRRWRPPRAARYVRGVLTSWSPNFFRRCDDSITIRCLACTCDRQERNRCKRIRLRRVSEVVMPPRTPPATARMRRLAFELRQLRKAAELTRDDVFEQTGINRATLYRIETSRGRPQARTLKALLDLYMVEPGKRAELAAL